MRIPELEVLVPTNLNLEPETAFPFCCISESEIARPTWMMSAAFTGTPTSGSAALLVAVPTVNGNPVIHGTMASGIGGTGGGVGGAMAATGSAPPKYISPK